MWHAQHQARIARRSMLAEYAAGMLRLDVQLDVFRIAFDDEARARAEAAAKTDTIFAAAGDSHAAAYIADLDTAVAGKAVAAIECLGRVRIGADGFLGRRRLGRARGKRREQQRECDAAGELAIDWIQDRKSTRLNSSH